MKQAAYMVCALYLCAMLLIRFGTLLFDDNQSPSGRIADVMMIVLLAISLWGIW